MIIMMIEGNLIGNLTTPNDFVQQRLYLNEGLPYRLSLINPDISM